MYAIVESPLTLEYYIRMENGSRISQILRTVWLAPVFVYRKLISPLLGPSCRYSPTCSAYMIEAVRKHGILKGTLLGTSRILRCSGLYTGGYDPVPDQFSFKGMNEARRSFSMRVQKKAASAENQSKEK